MRAKSFVDACFVPAAVALLACLLVSAHLAAPNSYAWTTNTLSELGAQGYEHAWIVRTGFLSFGSLVAGAMIRDLARGRRHWAQSIPLMLYGGSIAMTGVLSTSPFERSVSYSQTEAGVHSVFANVAGFSLAGAMLETGMVETSTTRRIAHFAGLAFVTLISALFMLQPEHQGVWQRVLWVGGLTWLAFAASFPPEPRGAG